MTKMQRRMAADAWRMWWNWKHHARSMKQPEPPHTLVMGLDPLRWWVD